MGRFRFMEQILKIISFIVGAVISVLIFCDKDNKESSSHVKYKEVVIFKEKQLERLFAYFCPTYRLGQI